MDFRSNYCEIYWRKYKWRLKKNYWSIFCNYINKFIRFHDILIESGAPYPFVIMNIDRAVKKGTYWWSFLDLHLKKGIFFIDSFEFTGFKEFIMNGNKRVINRIFYDIVIYIFLNFLLILKMNQEIEKTKKETMLELAFLWLIWKNIEK